MIRRPPAAPVPQPGAPKTALPNSRRVSSVKMMNVSPGSVHATGEDVCDHVENATQTSGFSIEVPNSSLSENIAEGKQWFVPFVVSMDRLLRAMKDPRAVEAAMIIITAARTGDLATSRSRSGISRLQK